MWPPFAPTFRRRDIFSIHVPRSGLAFAQELEWELAAHWWRYKPEEFAMLDGDEQSRRVAVYRIQHQMEAVVAQEQAKEAKRAARKGRRGPGSRPG